VINNGHISNFFNLQRDCRRGDPLSPYLFIIGVELLSLQIKSNPKIKGALVNDTESLISQFADDTFLVLDSCETSLRETLICFEHFYKASGMKINTSKTRVVWVGNKMYSNQFLCPDHTTLVLDVLIFKPEALQKFSKQIRVSLCDVSQLSSTRNVSSPN
jgi:hypothetical protein